MLLRFDSQLKRCAVGNHGEASVNSRSANFTAGFHSIEVDYCNMGGIASLSLYWKGPNDTTYSVRAVPCNSQTDSSPPPHKQDMEHRESIWSLRTLIFNETHICMFVCMLVCMRTFEVHGGLSALRSDFGNSILPLPDWRCLTRKRHNFVVAA